MQMEGLGCWFVLILFLVVSTPTMALELTTLGSSQSHSLLTESTRHPQNGRLLLAERVETRKAQITSSFLGTEGVC